MTWADYEFGGEVFDEAKKEIERLKFTDNRKYLSA